ncbi:hypothetical protein POVCU1_060100, partial [Plasmodium ovale curtisi]
NIKHYYKWMLNLELVYIVKTGFMKKYNNLSECVDLYIKKKKNCAVGNKFNVPCTAIEALKSSYEGTLRYAIKNINQFPSLSLISNFSEVDCFRNNLSSSLHQDGQTTKRGAMGQY